MRPCSWSVLLWLLLSTTATGRETRQGTVLVAGHPGGEPPVLYVAARLSTLVDFEDLLEPRVPLTPGLRERVGVVPVGARSLVVVPVRDLAEGERLLLPVTGRTQAGELRTLTLGGEDGPRESWAGGPSEAGARYAGQVWDAHACRPCPGLD